ncbi:MAG: acyl transferase [Crocinitomicaceae bacterium]
MEWKNKIFKNHSDREFEDLAFEVFRYQMDHCEVYYSFVNSVRKKSPRNLNEIPFLPISLFKTHKIITDKTPNTMDNVFMSSGTQGERSSHFVKDVNIYERSFELGFEFFIGDPNELIIIALLPNYLDQGDSSLVYMVDRLIKKTKSNHSRFILNDLEKIPEAIEKAMREGKKIVLFGVAYSLMDLMELNMDLRDCIVIETGGMKGRRKELSKVAMYKQLKEKLQISKLYSEYGMTELLSQAYSMDDFTFLTPPWMRVLYRDISDPFMMTNGDKGAGLNVIDLANIYSCSFIATDDLGLRRGNGFEIIGRIQDSDIRGCNLLIE